MDDVVRSFSAKNDTTYVVNFWATFCKPCIAEIPDFIKLAEKYKTKKVRLLLVSLDLPAYYPARIANFAKKNNYKTNIAWLNETNADHFCPMIDQKWSGAIPATIIVNNKTGYRKFVEDEISPKELEASLKEAIGGDVMNKYTAPMNDAEVIDNESIKHLADAKPMDYISFKSNDSSVYAVAAGKVTSIARIDDMKVLIIEKENSFYTYSNLGSVSLKVGEEVKPNQLIGYAAFDLDRYKPTLDLYITRVTNIEKNMVLAKTNFIKRSNDRGTGHSIKN